MARALRTLVLQLVAALVILALFYFVVGPLLGAMLPAILKGTVPHPTPGPTG
jgi:hypothetical protein